MVSQHPLFKSPADPKTPVWRYLDLAKFAQMLFAQELFLARADTLGDPYEGAVSAMNKKMRPLVYAAAPQILGQLEGMMKTMRRAMFVNCWHLAKSESFAMWKIYGGLGESIAIRSDFETLASVLPEHSYLGLVSYVDYDTTYIPENNAFAPVLHKRHYFKFENEVRAVISHHSTNPNKHGWKLTEDGLGIRVSVDLKKLIKEIYISPAARGWFRVLVADLIARSGFAFPLSHSRLNDDPVF